MRFYALACDYDGTLAHDGRVDAETLAALKRLVGSGRKLILVTGRELEDLLRVFPQAGLFARIVAENGALIYNPATRKEKVLGEPPPGELIQVLRAKGVEPLSVGRVIMATWHPHETTVLEAIRDLGLERQVIFNKGAVMILPSGMNKASGLKAALRELSLSPHNVVGVGDAENDHALLSLCECAVVVANALPTLKERADLVTRADHGQGVTELIDMMLATDLAELDPRLARHDLVLGTREDGESVRLNPYRESMMLAGTSGSGKSTFVTSFLERLVDHDYQFCIIDPEGDYDEIEDAVVIGDNKHVPDETEVLSLLEKPDENVVVSLLGAKLDDRPAFFQALFLRLMDLRARTGRPHWIVIDEAHHLMLTAWGGASTVVAKDLHGVLLVTVHPDHLSPAILSLIDTVIAIGETPGQTLKSLCEPIGQPPPASPNGKLDVGDAVIWFKRRHVEPFRFHAIPPRAERRRHVRKYAEGELEPDRSFYFRGPERKLKLRARNLEIFLQLAEGVDDETWRYHLGRGDYSRWFREAIKDPELAGEAEAIEKDEGASAEESRARMRELITRRYTAQA